MITNNHAVHDNEQLLLVISLISVSSASAGVLMKDCKSFQSIEKIESDMVGVSKLAQACAFSKAHALLKSRETAIEVAKASVNSCDKSLLLLESVMCKHAYRALEDRSAPLQMQRIDETQYDQMDGYKKQLIEDLRTYIIEERLKDN